MLQQIYNLKILITRPLRRVVVRPEVLLFIRQKAASMKWADLRMFKKPSKSVCVHQPLQYLLTHCLLLLQLLQL